MTLTDIQVQELLTAHCYRVLSSMNEDDLLSYAMQMMSQSFDKNPGQYDVDLDMLIGDILIAEDEDEESAAEFIVGTGIDPEVADALVNRQV
jgi:hypothetical protein